MTRTGWVARVAAVVFAVILASALSIERDVGAVGAVGAPTSAGRMALAQTDSSSDLSPPSETLRVVFTDIEPFVMRDNGNRADGFYAEIFREVALELGVEVEPIWVDSFGELFDSLDEGSADVAVAPIAPTAERERIYDFTSAVVSSGPQLGYHERAETSPRSVIGALADRRVIEVVVIALTGLVILAHIMWFLERRHVDREGGGDFDRSYLRGIWDGVWWATVTATTVGYGDKAPRTSAGKFVALMTMLLSLVLVGAFVSQVTNVLSENSVTAPFVNLKTLGNRPVGVVQETTFADFLVGEGATAVGYETQQEVFEAAERGEIDAMVANPFALAKVGPEYGVAGVGDVLYEEFETFGLPQGSPWREPLNGALATLQADGEIEEIITRWMTSD